MKSEKLNIRDKYIDKEEFQTEGIPNYQSKEHFDQASNFFQSLNLPKVVLEYEKAKCPKCSHLKKMFCLTCDQLLIEDQLPSINLPFKLRILHHNKEKHQKSSVLPVQFLSPQVEVYQYPVDTNYSFDANDYILYPHQDARFLSELSAQEISEMKSILAVDCTWRQTNQILKHLEDDFEGKRKYIKLGDYDTFFWRYQHHSTKCLATVEAVYYFYKEFCELTKKDINCDTLLYFYRTNFELIKTNLIGWNNNVYDKVQSKKERRLKQKIDLKESRRLERIK